MIAKGTSKGVAKLSSRVHLPNMGQLSDISEFLLGSVVLTRLVPPSWVSRAL